MEVIVAVHACDKPYMYGTLASEHGLFPEYYIPRSQHTHKTQAESVVKLLIDAGADLNIKALACAHVQCLKSTSVYYPSSI